MNKCCEKCVCEIKHHQENPDLKGSMCHDVFCTCHSKTSEPPKEDWKERFYELCKNWTSSQNGVCACLGNCPDCGFHRCHGCLCVFKPFIQSEIEKTRKEGWKEGILVMEKSRLEAINAAKQEERDRILSKRADIEKIIIGVYMEDLLVADAVDEIMKVLTQEETIQ